MLAKTLHGSRLGYRKIKLLKDLHLFRILPALPPLHLTRTETQTDVNIHLQTSIYSAVWVSEESSAIAVIHKSSLLPE